MTPYQITAALAAERRDTLLVQARLGRLAQQAHGQQKRTGAVRDRRPRPSRRGEPARPVEGFIRGLRQLGRWWSGSIPTRPDPVAIPPEPTPWERELGEHRPPVGAHGSSLVGREAAGSSNRDESCHTRRSPCRSS